MTIAEQNVRRDPDDEYRFQRNLIAVLSRLCHQRNMNFIDMGKAIGSEKRGMLAYEHCMAPIPILKLYAMGRFLGVSPAKILKAAEDLNDLFAEADDED